MCVKKIKIKAYLVSMELAESAERAASALCCRQIRGNTRKHVIGTPAVACQRCISHQTQLGKHPSQNHHPQRIQKGEQRTEIVGGNESDGQLEDLGMKQRADSLSQRHEGRHPPASE